jgi:hypothetical protein
MSSDRAKRSAAILLAILAALGSTASQPSPSERSHDDIASGRSAYSAGLPTRLCAGLDFHPAAACTTAVSVRFSQLIPATVIAGHKNPVA